MIQDIQNPDMSVEAGKFIGSFFITSIHEAIKKITKRENKTDHEIVISLADWSPVIEQLDYFKYVHNFSQEFLDHVSDRLFGIPNNGQAMSNKTELLQSTWINIYKNEYSQVIDELQAKMNYFHDSAIAHSKKQTQENYHWGHIDNTTKNCILLLSKGIPALHKDLSDFISDITEMSEKAIELSMPASELKDVDNWRYRIDSLAKRILGKADKIMISLIQILSFLYTMTMIKKNHDK